MGARNNRAGPFVGRSVKVVRDRVGRSVGRFTQWVTGRCAFVITLLSKVNRAPLSKIEPIRIFYHFLSSNILSYITYIIFEGGECTNRERERRKESARMDATTILPDHPV